MQNVPIPSPKLPKYGWTICLTKIDFVLLFSVFNYLNNLKHISNQGKLTKNYSLSYILYVG